ncbi:hypothetical protein AAZV13_02G192800 [Glycine max]
MAKTRRILHLVVLSGCKLCCHYLWIFGPLYSQGKLALATHGARGFDFNHGTHLKLLCSIAIAMVGPRGNSYWKPICGSIPNYCDKVTGAFAADLIAVVIYVKLLQLI